MIDFPHRLGLWKCIVSELELVERQAEGDKSERVVISGGGLEEMQRMHHRVMQRQAEQYVSYTCVHRRVTGTLNTMYWPSLVMCVGHK